jgi:hypothetical protein
MRWEVYTYGFHIATGLAQPATAVFTPFNRVLQKHGLPYLVPAQIDAQRYLVQSLDIYPTRFGTTSHLYERSVVGAWLVQLPEFAECWEFADVLSTRQFESRLVYASPRDLGAQFGPIMTALGYRDDVVRARLADLWRAEYPLYPCLDACVRAVQAGRRGHTTMFFYDVHRHHLRGIRRLSHTLFLSCSASRPRALAPCTISGLVARDCYRL